MSVTVFYFTGTGNSLAAARTLAGRLKEAVVLPLAGILHAGKKFQVHTEKAVFIFPVYCAGIPALVARALELVDLSKTSYVAAIANCANSAGAALDIFAAELRRCCNKSLAAGWVIYMPGNYTPLYGSDSPDTIKRTLRECDNRLLEIACAVNQGTAVDYALPMPLALLTGFLWKINICGFPYMQKRFKAERTCTGCGLCAKVCPVDNIVISSAGRPQWLKKCEQCMACLQYCPVEAIQCLWWTKGRARYKHPGIVASEITAQKRMPEAQENR